MHQLLEVPDRADPAVAARIRRNERVAREASASMLRRFRKQEPEQAFENYANTIGVLCAKLIKDGHEIAGPEFANAMRDMICFHMDRMIEASASGKEG